LFATVDSLELTREELNVLEVVALEDWSQIRPAIFGNIFESAIDAGERHAHGIHYTSEADIMKIVRPTISRYWEERIEGANSLKALTILQEELRNYRVLDPACGSGNFLYLAYQELKRIERDLLDKIAERRRSGGDQLQMGFVTPLQFFGMDNNRFAVELARVTLMIARKVAIDRLGLIESALPLDTLDQNIVCQDALFTEWPKANAIIGNPPFLGGNRVRQVLGDEYSEKIFARFPKVKSQVDFCCYWFRLAHENSSKNERVGLVGTNTISQGNTRIASLDYITQNGGYLHDAISTQKWSGDAKVYVSLVNWQYHKSQELYLDNTLVKKINSSLKSDTSVSESLTLKVNKNFCFEGAKPNAKNFLISESYVDEWIQEKSENESVLKPFLDANDLTKEPNGKPSRWIIDFENRTLEEVSCFNHPFEYVKIHVKPERENCREKVLREKWWRFKRTHAAMRDALNPLDQYFAIPAHSKWFIFVPSQASWLPGNSTKVVASDDFYILGILTSKTHRVWVKAQSSTLKGDTRYTHKTCFETFPFPQTPARKIVEKIRAAAVELHEYRSEQMERKQWGITKLYNAYFDEPASQLYKLHQKLDALVLQAYGFSPDDDLLEKLLALNLELAAKEQAGAAVIGPYDPNRNKD
jgi:SAM-dependent methyltransferase